MKKLQEIFEKLARKVEMVRALCPDILDLYVPSAEKALKEAERVLVILADPKGTMNSRTVDFIGASAEMTVGFLAKYERKFLQSLAVAKMMRTRIIEKIEPEIYEKRTVEIERVFEAWDSLRANGSTYDLRCAYMALARAVESAEEASIKYRLRMAISPAQAVKTAPERKRTEQSTNVGPKTLKGPVGQKTDKNGGFGTNKKSVQKRRRRQGKKAAA